MRVPPDVGKGKDQGFRSPPVFTKSQENLDGLLYQGGSFTLSSELDQNVSLQQSQFGSFAILSEMQLSRPLKVVQSSLVGVRGKRLHACFLQIHDGAGPALRSRLCKVVRQPCRLDLLPVIREQL